MKETAMIDSTKSANSLTPTFTSTPEPKPTPMWYAVSDFVPVPNTSMLPPLDKLAVDGDDLIETVVKAPHTNIDDAEDDAAPTLRKPGVSVTRAKDALQVPPNQIRQTAGSWSQSLKSGVRGNPLAYLAGALLVGALIARVRR